MEREMTVGVAKAAHLFSLYCKDPWNQIRRIALKDNIGMQLTLHLLHHPVLPFCRIIFSFTGKEHVWSPLLLETRLASEVPPSRPFSPPSLSVWLCRAHVLRHGTGKAKRTGKGLCSRAQMWDTVPKWASVLPSEGSYYIQRLAFRNEAALLLDQ